MMIFDFFRWIVSEDNDNSEQAAIGLSKSKTLNLN